MLSNHGFWLSFPIQLFYDHMNRSSGSTDAAWSSSPGGSMPPVASPHTTELPSSRRSLRKHILTVALEDYYHASSFRHRIRQDTWYRFEDRLVSSTVRALDLLDSCGARATFFVGLQTAESAPELVREVARRGHEIASRGDLRLSRSELNAERLREDAARCQEQLQELINQRVVGYRLADGWLGPDDLWVLDILADCGYLYDSSVGPMLRPGAADTWLRSRPPWSMSQRGFREVPVSSLPFMGLQVPVTGGGLLRLMPSRYVRLGLARWHSSRTDPYVMHFRTWELDPAQPRISAGSVTSRLHYRNLDRLPGLLEELLRRYRFTSVASHLGIDLSLNQLATGTTSDSIKLSFQSRPSRLTAKSNGSQEPTPVTVVIPCFNETQSLSYLKNTLRRVAERLRHRYRFNFIFVDDCSTDDTWRLLQELFGEWTNCHFARHESNRGVAASIQTGIRLAETEIVCSIDCDCTYDPHELGEMIPLLTDGVDLVTASPYHPEGRVRNLANWRLFLSRSLSRLYRLVLRQKLFTYTSCFRVYRRQSAAQLELRNPGFLGVAELLARGDIAGQRVVEYPTTLDSRVLGTSKMRVARTIAGHLRLLAELFRLRYMQRRASLKMDTVS
jgi:polysaccharide deacetylase family protein (PEP-CTERM system associated)